MLRGFLFPVVCYRGFSACKWSAKANIPETPPEGVSLLHFQTEGEKRCFLNLKAWRHVTGETRHTHMNMYCK